MATSLTIFIRDGYPTYSSCVIDVSFTVTYAASYKTRFDLYQNGSFVSTSWGSTYTLSAGGSKDNLRKTFSGLLPDTDYEIIAELYNATTNAGLGVTDSVSFTTESEPAPQRPANWSWSSKVQKGSSVTLTSVGENAYEAAYLTATEWNAFWDRLVEFARYKGLSVSGSLNRVSAGDPMLASQANDARTMISLLEPTIALPAEVSSDSKITAAFINGLANSLNSVE